jgi:hypothetical protein
MEDCCPQEGHEERVAVNILQTRMEKNEEPGVGAREEGTEAETDKEARRPRSPSGDSSERETRLRDRGASAKRKMCEPTRRSSSHSRLCCAQHRRRTICSHRGSEWQGVTRVVHRVPDGTDARRGRKPISHCCSLFSVRNPTRRRSLPVPFSQFRHGESIGHP